MLTQFWFTRSTGWSGQKFYVEWGSQTFNLLYTVLPSLILAVYDTDISADMALRYAQLYDFSRESKGLNFGVFLMWISGALLESVVIYFFCALAYWTPAGPGPAAANAGGGGSGATPYIFELGTLAFTAVIAVVTVRVAAEMHRHHLFFVVLTAGSALLWLPACFVFDAINADAMRGGMTRVFGSLTFWATLGVIVGTLTTRLLAWKAYLRLFCPELRHVVQEAEAITGDMSSLDAYVSTLAEAQRVGHAGGDVKFSLRERPRVKASGAARAPQLSMRMVRNGVHNHWTHVTLPQPRTSLVDPATNAESLGAIAVNGSTRTLSVTVVPAVHSQVPVILTRAVQQSLSPAGDLTEARDMVSSPASTTNSHALQHASLGGSMFEIDAASAATIGERYALFGVDNADSSRAGRVWLQDRTTVIS